MGYSLGAPSCGRARRAFLPTRLSSHADVPEVTGEALPEITDQNAPCRRTQVKRSCRLAGASTERGNWPVGFATAERVALSSGQSISPPGRSAEQYFCVTLTHSSYLDSCPISPSDSWLDAKHRLRLEVRSSRWCPARACAASRSLGTATSLTGPRVVQAGPVVGTTR